MMNNNPVMAYDSLIEAILATTSPREYTLTGTETVSSKLGTMGGTSSILTIDGGTGHYGINNTSTAKDSRLLVGGTNTLNLQNLGTYTPVTSNTILAGKSVITDVIVGNSVNNFGITGDNVGFLRSAGTSNISNSVFYNNFGVYGAALQNRESGTMTINGSVFVGNTSEQGAVHNDGAGTITKIADSIFFNNTATESSAIYNKKDKTIVLIDGSSFVNNSAASNTLVTGTLFNSGTINTISNSIFYNNTNDSASNGVITVYNTTSGTTAGIGLIDNVDIVNNTGTGIFLKAMAANETINIGTITQSKINSNTGYGLYVGENLGVINIDEISNSEFSNNGKRGIYIRNKDSGSPNTIIERITNTIIDGNADGGIGFYKGNGTLTVDELSGLEIKNNTKTSGTGAGLSNVGATIGSISNVTFENNGLGYNTANTQGGAIYNTGTINEIVNTTISGNSAYNGGAIYNIGTIGSIENVTASENLTSDCIIANEDGAVINLVDNLTIDNSPGTGIRAGCWGRRRTRKKSAEGAAGDEDGDEVSGGGRGR